jgi:hypothetical protein
MTAEHRRVVGTKMLYDSQFRADHRIPPGQGPGAQRLGLLPTSRPREHRRHASARPRDQAALRGAAFR